MKEGMPEPSYDSEEKPEVSEVEIAHAKAWGGKYGRKAIKMARLLGEKTYQFADDYRYEDDNIIIEENEGADYYDGQDLSSVKVYAKSKSEEGGEPRLVLDYGTEKVGFLRKVKRFNRGDWMQDMDSLGDDLKRAEAARDLQKNLSESEAFLPVGYEGDGVLSRAEIAEAKAKGKKYVRQIQDIANYLGKRLWDYSKEDVRRFFDSGAGPADNAYEDEDVILGYDDGDDVESPYVWIVQKTKNEDGSENCQSVFEGRIRLFNRVTRYNAGPWEEKIQQLTDRVQMVKAEQKAQAAQDRQDRYRPEE